MRRLLVPFSPLLVVCGLALLASSSADAQVLRPSESIYLQFRGGATAYSGDLNDSANPNPGDGFSNPGYGVGGEVGYILNPNLSFGLGFLFHDLTIGNGIVYNPATNQFDSQTQDDTAYQIQGLLRYSPLSGFISPYVEIGGAFVVGQGTEAGRDATPATDDVLGYGPLAGLGVDVAVTPQLGLMIGAQSTFVFPDVALDNADIGAFTNGDQAEFDVLTTLGGGLRYALRSPYTPVEITRLDCPGEVTQGESASFMVSTNADATPPVSVSWDWGDGSSGAGLAASHTYRSTGTYTVTAMAAGDRNDDTATCTVTVVEPQIPPVLSACRISPVQVTTNEAISLSGRVNSDAIQPVSISVNWGDGNMDQGATFPASHRYSEAGTYTVTATARNAYGENACTTTVTVSNGRCASVSELNSVYFEFGSSALTAAARDRLDENLDILRPCQDICVLIRAYTDSRERNQLRLSQARADAIRDYYMSNGMDAGRFRAEGLGADPASNPKEDPGPGDRRSRRADSVPATCGSFTPTGSSRR